jgi:uncharacterized OB-fold protein
MIPRRAVCPACGSVAVDAEAMGPDGMVLHWSDLTVSVDAVPAPYWVGMIQLTEGPVLFARIEGKPTVGQRVVLSGDPEEDIYWFISMDFAASGKEV